MGRESARPSRGRRHIVVAPRELFPVRLSRLMHDELHEIRPFAVPIEPDSLLDLSYPWEERLLLPKTFLASEALFGRSSKLYDDYKSSFCFPLLLSAARRGVAMRYIVMLGDVRGAVNLRFYRIGERIAEGMDRYHAPVEHELSRKDLNRLTEFVLGFLLGRAESEVAGAPSFYRVVRSELLVYGKRRGDLFERQLDDHSAFEDFVGAIKRELGEAQRQADVEYVGDLLDRIGAENTPVA